MKVKVIEITKSYRNMGVDGIKTHCLVLDKNAKKKDIEDIVDNWCKQDPDGQVYGWGVKWKVVSDKSVIREVLEKEIVRIDQNIKTETAWMGVLDRMIERYK